MATFQRAPEEVEQMLDKVLRECYPQLHGFTKEAPTPLRFDLLFVRADRDANNEPVGPALHHHGRSAYAVIKAVPKAQRALGLADVEIRFDADQWENEKWSDERREALLDHELYHLELVTQEGTPKRDDLGRLRFRMRPHDYEFGWFREVAERRGGHSIEVTQARQMYEQDSQILFNFQDDLPHIPAVVLPTSTGQQQAKAHGLEVVEGGVKVFTWERMDDLQKEAARDAFQHRMEVTAHFHFRGPLCVGQQTGPGAEVLKPEDVEPLRQEGEGAPANEAPAKAPKRSRGKAAASKK